MKHFQYLWYIIRHKFFVMEAGLVMRRCGIHISLWRLLMHDMSKLLPSEWFPHVNKFYGKGDSPMPYELDCAWLRHQHRNPHHWQYWVLREDSIAAKPLCPPAQYLHEMIADWAGAGRAITGRWELALWFKENKDMILLNPCSEVMVCVYVEKLDRDLKERRRPWPLY